MVCKAEYPDGSMRIDTDKIAERFINGEKLYVRTSSGKERQEFIGFLLDEGFRFADRSFSKKQDITDTGLPLVISIEEKSIAGMRNVTCAAAAAGSGIVMDTGYFCMLYTLRHKSGRK